MTEQKILLTAEDFFRLYGGRDGKAELVCGIVVTPGTVSEKHGVEMAPVSEEHGEVAINVGTAFKNYSRQRGMGRVGVEIGYVLSRNPDTVRAPDVSFYLKRRTEGEARRSGFVPGVPDIAVEVVLPSSTAGQLEQKIGEYLAAGALRVWVVYTSSRRVMVHRSEGTVEAYSGDDVIHDEELLPGFSLPLAEIFA
jgi:Uma2 family endonuclease